MRPGDEVGGGAFAEVRDGTHVEPTIRETSVEPHEPPTPQR